MSKFGKFIRSLLPFIIALVLRFLITLGVGAIFIIRGIGDGSFALATLVENVETMQTDVLFNQTSNLVYGIVALIFFGIWYFRVLVRPFRKKQKDYVTGFSFHTICALIFMGIGLQYIATLVVDIISRYIPAGLASYEAILQSVGFDQSNYLLLLYTLILAPIVEELLYRGLIFRYARYAAPFWVANCWQALLFGILHMNLLQGVYAFILGLFLGYVCHRGRGIKYSIVLHIIFNLIGAVFTGIIDFTTKISYSGFMGLGIVLTLFALWLYHTDFIPAKSKQRVAPKQDYEDLDDYDDYEEYDDYYEDYEEYDYDRSYRRR